MPSSYSERSFWPAFQTRWAALLCEQTAGLFAWSEAMRRALGRGVIEVPNSADAHAALDHLNARLARLENVRQLQTASAKSPAENLVADDAMLPHFVRYGAALLSSPLAAPASDDEAETALDYEMLRLAIGDLCAWLELLKLVPRQILLLEDFDSQIIGRAIALQLDVSHKIVDDASYTRSKSLIVSADSRHLTSAVLRVVFPGQVLYSLNLARASGAIAPDVSSLCQPKLLLPWHEQQLTSRKISGLAERVSNAPLPASQDDWPARLEFYRARRAYLTAGNSVFNRSPMLPESF